MCYLSWWVTGHWSTKGPVVFLWYRLMLPFKKHHMFKVYTLWKMDQQPLKMYIFPSENGYIPAIAMSALPEAIFWFNKVACCVNHHFHIHYTISCLRHEWEKTKHPWRLAWNIILEVWFRSCSFLFMGDGCSFQPFIFQASREWGSPTGITQHVEVFKETFNLYSLRNDGVVFEGKRHKFPWRRGATLVFWSQMLTKKCIRRAIFVISSNG